MLSPAQLLTVLTFSLKKAKCEQAPGANRASALTRRRRRDFRVIRMILTSRSQTHFKHQPHEYVHRNKMKFG